MVPKGRAAYQYYPLWAQRKVIEKPEEKKQQNDCDRKNADREPELHAESPACLLISGIDTGRGQWGGQRRVAFLTICWANCRDGVRSPG